MTREDERGNDRLIAGCLAAASVAVNLALLALLGVQRGADTDRYIEGAADLVAGRRFGGPSGWVYIGYNGLLAIAESAGVGQLGVVGVQILAVACATMALYDLARTVGGRAAGCLAAAFFVVDYDIARWHLYILTDSLYISFVVLVTWAAHRAVGRGVLAYLAASMVLLPTALVRPNGWMMVPLVAIYWVVQSAMRRRVQIAAVAALVVVCGGGAATVAAIQFSGDTAPRRMPVASPQVNRQLLPFARAMRIRKRLNPAQMPIRLISVLGHLQPRFSLRHKIIVSVMLAVVYPLAVGGFVVSRGQPIAQFMAAIVACHLLLVTVMFNDRDGRYLLYIFPLVVVFAARGAVETVMRR
jgi:hypothetical protein